MRMKKKKTSFYAKYKNKVSSFIKKQRFLRKHKKKIKILLWTFFIIFFIWFLFNFSINLYLNSEPQIKISPQQLSVRLENNQIKTYQYEVQVDKPFFCKTSCVYKFVDRSQTERDENLTLDIKKLNNINVTIKGPGKGSGQKIYNLEVICETQETFLCSEDETKKSSFVILSYDLSVREKEVKETLRVPLSNYFEVLNKIYFSIYRMNETLNVNPKFIETDFYNVELSSFVQDFNKHSQIAQEFISLWEDEEYIVLEQENISKSLEQSKAFLSEISFVQDSLNHDIIFENSSIELYNQNLNVFSQILNTSELTVLLPNASSLYEEALVLNQYYENISLDYQNQNYEYVEQFNESVLSLAAEQDNYSSKVIDKRVQINNELFDLVSAEKQKRCYINNCYQTNKTYCDSLLELFFNSSFMTYEIPLDTILIYNNTYYNSSGIITNISEVNISEVIELNLSDYEVLSNKIVLKGRNNLQNQYSQLCQINTSLNLNFDNISTIKELVIPVVLQEDVNKTFSTELVEKLPQCCLSNICTNCCLDSSCRSDVKTYPVLLIHGHSLIKSSPTEPSIDAFNKIGFQLVQDNYIDAGILSFTNISNEDTSWQYLTSPVVVKASYYYDSFYSLGSYVYITKKNDNIDTYAIRLSEIITELKYKTQRPKVNIVAHSMGGLVVRRYIQIFGSDSIDKVILIATANHGITGRTKYLCSVIGEKLECEDMYDDSILIAKLNSPNNIPNVKMYTISGLGCDISGQDGDGVVTLNSSLLSYAQSYIINGTCNDILGTELHTNLLDIDKYPQVYDDIIEILSQE